jgi:putative transposase
MKDQLVLLAHLLMTVAKILGPGGTRAVVADSLLSKQQLLVISRSRRRAPNLSAIDRLLLGFRSLFLSPHCVQRAAVIIRPSTLLRFPEALKKPKCRLQFSRSRRPKRSPTGPSQERIEMMVELKRCNARFGCRPIALIISRTFGQELTRLSCNGSL